MSSLGIRFATPYKGSNGIKVVNNVIEIDPKETIIFFNGNDIATSTHTLLINDNGIIINEKDGNNNILNVTNLSPNNINLQDIINELQMSLNAEQIQINDNPNHLENIISNQGLQITIYDNLNNAIKQINIYGDYIAIDDIDGGYNSQLSGEKLNMSPYIVSHDDGFKMPTDNIVNIIGDNTGAVTPNLTKYISINIANTIYKLIIAQ